MYKKGNSSFFYLLSLFLGPRGHLIVPYLIVPVPSSAKNPHHLYSLYILVGLICLICRTTVNLSNQIFCGQGGHVGQGQGEPGVQGGQGGQGRQAMVV